MNIKIKSLSFNFQYWSTLLVLIVLSITNTQLVTAQQTKLTGVTYQERAKSMVKLWSSVSPKGGDMKYTAPYYWAKIYANVGRDSAIKQISLMLDGYQTDRSFMDPTGSNLNFYIHSAIHGYFVDKQFLPDSIKTKIKRFVEGYDLTTYKNGSATLNMQMMVSSAAFLAAEEWPDISDSLGHNRDTILNKNKPFILSTLSSFFHHNCREADAFIYFPTDVQYVRMLAEFAVDAEVKKSAVCAYQYMIASMVSGWNNGLFVATPARSKGWSDLITGRSVNANNITALCWLYFGDTSQQITMTPSVTVTGNKCATLFWVAYQRNILPLQSIFDENKAKILPYEHWGLTNDTEISCKYFKYSFQSPNYGLATQSEFPNSTNNIESRYYYKETKRNYLAWQSTNSACAFSVCQDNPASPTDTINRNIAGYGENPYGRVLQMKKAVVGLYNVPITYLSGNMYRLYAPFTKNGILLRMENKGGWILCHTGTMMFAFKTIEPYQWNNPLNPSEFSLSGYDILTLADTNARRGGWMMETTEISPKYSGGTVAQQLNLFSADLLANKRFDTLPGYSTSANARIKYYSLDGDTLDLTFFPPSTLYNKQYLINSAPVSFTPSYIFNNPYQSQLDNSDTLFIKGGQDTLIWNSPSVVNYTRMGSTYLQDFNTLPINGAYQNNYYTTQGPFELMNQGFKVIGGKEDGKTLMTPSMIGWQVYKITTADTAVIMADNGSNDKGYLKSYGDSSSSDRSFGLSNTTTSRNAFGLIIRNNTGQTLHSCRIGYLGKQWRISNNATNQVIKCSYKLINNAAILNGINQTGLIDIPSLRFASPHTIGSIGAIDGNLPENQTQISANLKGLNWINGNYMILRFDDSLINSQGLAIDNFTFLADTTINLPLKLISFDGQSNNRLVKLKWKTSNEQEIQSFEVERSLNGIDDFKIMATVLPKNQLHNQYDYNDVIPLGVTSLYYRLRIINQDGSYEYSNVISVNNSSSNPKVVIYPNPTTSKLTIEIHEKSTDSYKISIINNKGEVVKSFNLNGVKETYDIGNLAAGAYLIEIRNTKNNVLMNTSKLIKR